MLVSASDLPPAAANRPGILRRLKAGLSARPELGALAALIALILGFGFFAENFLTARNVSLVLQQTAVLAILALGQTLIILTAGVDLALGAIAVVATIIAANLALAGVPALLALSAALLVAVLASGLNGLLVARIGLPPFIVTLGSFTVLTAVAYLLSGSRSQLVPKGLLTVFGNGFTLGGVFVAWSIPALLLLYVIFAHMLRRTAFGRHILATGDNPTAARVAGLRVSRVLILVYLIAGVLYGLGAWVSLGRIPSADPNAMQAIALQSITAVVLGGTSFFGGRGSVIGTLAGALIVGVLRNGLTLSGVDSLYQDIITGVLIIATVSLDQLSRKGAT